MHRWTNKRRVMFSLSRYHILLLARQSGKFIELISVIGLYFRSPVLSLSLCFVFILYSSFSHLLLVMSSGFCPPTSSAPTNIFIVIFFVLSHHTHTQAHSNTIINMQAYGLGNGRCVKVPLKGQIARPNINYFE